MATLGIGVSLLFVGAVMIDLRIDGFT